MYHVNIKMITFDPKRGLVICNENSDMLKQTFDILTCHVNPVGPFFA